MRLRAERAQAVHLKRLGLRVLFATGEELRTEVSAKFRRTGVAAELAAAGFAAKQWWTDRAGRFGVTAAQAV
jgi:L-histidine N-alpha-methyltransferase